MPVHTRERAMLGEERAILRRIIEGRNRRVGAMGRFRLAINVGVATWVISMVVIRLSYLLIAWLVLVTTGTEIGPQSSVGPSLIPISFLASTVIAVFTAVFWVARREKKMKVRPELIADLEAGRVVEEDYDFSAAVRMQEQEHGGLIYFLRTTDGRVMVHYDHESQDISVQGNDPLTSSFNPCRRLTMVRAPESGFVIDKSFSGEPLDPGEMLDLLAEDWPEDEEFCDVPWEDLETKYCR